MDIWAFPTGQISCSEGVFWNRGLFRKVNFLEIPENLEILEFLENPHTVEKTGEADHCLEILETLEILRDSRNFSSEKTPFVMTPFSGPENRRQTRANADKHEQTQNQRIFEGA